MENTFLWLADQFGHNNIANWPMLFPTHEEFPISYNGSEDVLHQTAAIVAKQMDIDLLQVRFRVYDREVRLFANAAGHRLLTAAGHDRFEKYPDMHFDEEVSDDESEILISKRFLSDPTALITTLSREFARIKIHGEQRIEFKDDDLINFTPIIFGLGIFNANNAYENHKSSYLYEHSGFGNMEERDWGYALALYAFFRRERHPAWVRFLPKKIRIDFRKSTAYMYADPERIFNEDFKRSG